MKYKLTKLWQGFMIIMLIMIGSQSIFAQQLPLFTQYREVQGLINPASVNHDYFLEHYNVSAGATYRSQWNDIAGHPVTSAVRAEYIIVPEKTTFSLLTGAYYLSDKAGLTNKQSAYLRLGTIYSQNPANSGIGIGMNLGMVWNSFNFGGVKLSDPFDISIDGVDRTSYVDVGVGAYYYKTIRQGALKGDQIYAGISVPQIMNQSYVVKNGEQSFTIKRIPHIYAHAGYYKTLSEKMYLSGSLWYKYAKGSKSVIDFNARMYMFDKLWVGAGISTIGMIHIEAGTILGKYFNFNNFNMKIGYAADLNTGELAQNLGISHEINFVFFFDTENK
ncbi:MAG: PorP/SprF family type IX secretion system membrane protein [Saprospiraceae bacterium]